VAHIRQFAPDDIPAIVALRRKTFRHSERPTAAELGAYFEQIFFRNPWCDEGIPSLVYTNGTGAIVGFMGVVPRPATFQNRPIRVAVGTQLMVDPAARGLVGVALVKAFLSGPQDLSLADLANDVSRRLWEALGGSVSLVQSLHWTQPLRSARFYVGRVAQRLHARPLAWGLRPLSWAIDGLTARWAPARGLQEAPLTPALMAAHLPDLLGHATLQPRYDEGSLRWLLDQLAATRKWGKLRGVAVRGPDDSLVGWYLYYANAGGVGQVVQVAARRDQGSDVLQCLFHHAWERGLVALQGRLEPGLLSALGARGARLARDGPWVLVQSRRPELLAAIHRGDTSLSRLDGEWWMCF
jgi:hypothetical protein